MVEWVDPDLNAMHLSLSQLLLNPEMVKACPTLTPYIYDFLENKAYSKGKGDFARKVSERHPTNGFPPSPSVIIGCLTRCPLL